MANNAEDIENNMDQQETNVASEPPQQPQEAAVDQSKTGSLPLLGLHVWWKQRRTRTKS